MKRILLFFIIIVLAFLFYLPNGAVAADGEDVFHNKCGQCHGDLKAAPDFSPAKYASTQWKRFFSRDKHSRKKDISGLFSKEELHAVEKYLILHAADSDHPEAIGLR